MARYVLYEPTTILLAVAAGSQVLGSIQEGRAARAEAEGEANFLQAQAGAEEVQRRREIRDLRKERSQFLARSRAVFAAQGGDTTSGTALAVLQSQASEFAVRESRIRRDSVLRAATFRTRASNVRDVGRQAQQISFLRAVGSGFARGARLLERGGEDDD